MSNNDRFKFRAWDTGRKIMLHHANAQNGSDCITMQCTGLKDRKNKLIYEGDILRYLPKDSFEKENYVAYEVFWHDNNHAENHIGWQCNRPHFMGRLCGGCYTNSFLPKNAVKMEIIGNIYENPELLEGSK